MEEKEAKQSEVKALTEKYEKEMKEFREQTDAKLDRIFSVIQQYPELVNLKPQILSTKLDKLE